MTKDIEVEFHVDELHLTERGARALLQLLTDERAREITESAELVTTVACRACHAGWYGEATERCPRCGGKIVVTDAFVSIPVAVLG